MSDNTKVTETKAVLATGGRIAPIVPTDFEQAYRLSKVLAASGMVPKAYVDKQGNANVEMICVGIMHGLEVGLTPMAALQSIAVINGTPSIWGDGMLALVRSSGLLEDIVEHVEIGQDGLPDYGHVKVKRKGQPTWIEHTFTRVQAQKAGLWGKQGPWTQYPQRMIIWRPRSWALRDAFPDVLRGLHSREEIEDMVDVTNVGSVTTTPPEPRRAAFRAQRTPTENDRGPEAMENARRAVEANESKRDEEPTWLMFDYTGEEGDQFYTAGQWLDAFTQAMQKGSDEIRAGLMRANEDTVVDILAKGNLDEEQKAGLRAFYDPPAEEEQLIRARDWSIPDNIVGQDKKLGAFYDLLAKAETPADVEDLTVANEGFLAKLGNLKKAEAEKRLMDAKIELGQRQAAE